MFNLFLIMLLTGILSLLIALFLYLHWNISDALDEISGKKRKRQVEKLQKASMSIGATSVVVSTTQMFKDSEEDEEIATIIQNAHSTEGVEEGMASGNIGETSTILDEIAGTAFSNFSSVSRRNKIEIVEEIGNWR